MLRIILGLSVITLLAIKYISSEIRFLKTLDGETFKTDLMPSLSSNISYVTAIDSNKPGQNASLAYYLNSTEFMIHERTGQIFLISKLGSDLKKTKNYRSIEVTARNDQGESLTINSQISILNVVTKRPEFMTKQRIYEIEEDNLFPSDITLRNGTVAEIWLHDENSQSSEISISCQNTKNFPNVCDTFGFKKNLLKSTKTDWFGTIRVYKKLSFLEKSYYQLMAVAKRNQNVTKIVTFQIRVMTNLNRPPQISTSSLLFSIAEEQLPNTLIGSINLAKEYDDHFKSVAIVTIVDNLQELINNNIPSRELNDVDLDLVNTYVKITGNELLTKAIIDRDSPEFTNINGILKLWIKVFYNFSPYNANYYKITIVILDLDDNQPNFGFIRTLNTNNNTFIPLKDNKFLTTTINENEIGQIIFDTIKNGKYLCTNDFDLAENSTFEIKLSPIDSLTFAENHARLDTFAAGSSSNFYQNENCLSQNQLNKHFALMPPIVEMKSSFNLMNYNSFDFESLNTLPSVDTETGIGTKSMKFNVNLRGTSPNKLQVVTSLPVVITIQDLNDNKPIFTNDTFYIVVTKILNEPYKSPQELVQFEVKDKDFGKYGINGLVCSLMGNGYEKFYVDSTLQKIYLNSCINGACSLNYYESVYYLTLICKDNNGQGNVGFASLIVNFESVYRSDFIMKNSIYYLLASGPSGTEIPNLYIKPLNLDKSNRVSYSIEIEAMSRLFTINPDGLFRIKVNQLVVEQCNQPNRIFFIPVLIKDLNGYTNRVTIFLQLSNLINQFRCPRINELAMCSFNINPNRFDPSDEKFCFYGSNPLSVNLNVDTSSFYDQIFYSLQSSSPNYLYINPYDGCVRILPSFDIKKLSSSEIKYSVGVFRPSYPDCVNIMPKSCSIKVEKSSEAPTIKCDNKYSIITNQTTFRLVAYSSNPSSLLNYDLIREERLAIDRTYQVVVNNGDFSFKIGRPDGFIQIANQQILNKYLSISLIVKVSDAAFNSSSTKCLVDFRFSNNLILNPPKFIGGPQRLEYVCEDVPTNSIFMSLSSFDPSLSNKPLCYGVLENEYFSLANRNQVFQPQTDCSSSSDGSIVLKNQVKYKTALELNKNLIALLNFTALLYYCNEPVIFDKQLVGVLVKNVNKYAPQLLTDSTPQIMTISLNSLSNYTTTTLNVIDYDESPYNSFICNVENDPNFLILHLDDDKIAIKYLNPFLLSQQYTPHFDLSIRCCDDSVKWNENDCFSMKKCSMKPVRIVFTDYSLPIFCVNNEQDLYLAENTQSNNVVSFAACVTNYTQQSINYQLLADSEFFYVDSKTGLIYLKNQLTNPSFQNQTLFIECSNGVQSDICKVNVMVIAVYDFRPIWITPNMNNFDSCFSVFEDTPVNSLVATVNAQIFDFNTPITYSFVYNGFFTNQIYEFEFRDVFSGKIYLAKNINNPQNQLREITLAASIKRGTDQFPITTYQYLCIKIIPSNLHQPCFRTKPDNTKWPYQIDLAYNTTEKCFPNQLVSIYNQDLIFSPYYFYIISLNYQIDTFYQRFVINAQTGLICLNDMASYQTLLFDLVNTPFKYFDNSNRLCYNLALYVSKEILTPFDLSSITYDDRNCSFTYVKICVNNFNSNYNQPLFNKTKPCEASLTLDDFSQQETECVIDLNFIYPLQNKNSYDYSVQYDKISFLPEKDPTIFFINKTTDFISLKLNNVTNKNSFIGKHLLNITVRDNFLQSDTINCSIYISQSCKVRGFVNVDNDVQYVLANLDRYIRFLSKAIFNSYKRNFDVNVYNIFEAKINKFNDQIGTKIEISFFDQQRQMFLLRSDSNSRINLQSKEAKNLKIISVQSACPAIISENTTIQIIGLALWSFLLLVLLIAIPSILFCVLCFIFKKLKYQNSRVIMKEKVIPILQMQGSCSEPCFEPCVEPCVEPCIEPLEQASSYQAACNLIKGGSSFAPKKLNKEVGQKFIDVEAIIDEKKAKKNDELDAKIIKTYEKSNMIRQANTADKAAVSSQAKFSKMVTYENHNNAFNDEMIDKLSINVNEETNNNMLRAYMIQNSPQRRMPSPVDRFREYQMYDTVNSRQYDMQQIEQHQRSTFRDDIYFTNQTNNSSTLSKSMNDMQIFREPLGEIATISFSNDLDVITNERQKKNNKRSNDKRGYLGSKRKSKSQPRM